MLDKEREGEVYWERKSKREKERQREREKEREREKKKERIPNWCMKGTRKNSSINYSMNNGYNLC